MFEVRLQSFKLTIVDKYNTTIIGTDGDYSQRVAEVNVFYNCGELDWSYIVSEYVNGPNYNLTL